MTTSRLVSLAAWSATLSWISSQTFAYSVASAISLSTRAAATVRRILFASRKPMTFTSSPRAGSFFFSFVVRNRSVSSTRRSVSEDGFLLEDPAEVHRARADLAVPVDVLLHVEVGADRPDVLLRRIDGDLADRELLAVHLGGRPAHQEDVHRGRDAAPAELRLRAPADHLGLVGVVVEDAPVLVEVEPAEGPAHALGDPVRDGIGMTEPLPLDQLDLLFLDVDRPERLDDDVAGHGGYSGSCESAVGIRIA